jgi:hypothetical protein
VTAEKRFATAGRHALGEEATTIAVFNPKHGGIPKISGQFGLPEPLMIAARREIAEANSARMVGASAKPRRIGSAMVG